VVPVFPLPELVLFPGLTVPLHVFELRYRTMVRDALSRGRVLAIAVLAPGYELDYHGSPPYHPIGCLARIDEVEWLPNDRYDLLVTGTMRVRFGRVEREFPYRAAHVEPLPQHPYSEDDPLIELDKQVLVELHGRVVAAVRARGDDESLLPECSEADPYERIVNSLCAYCGATAEDRLALLAEDSLIERARRVRESLERALGAKRPPGAPTDGGEAN